ncbi:MAG: polysaccharide biosynthesis/export family protein [Planctomycetia bacterium]|nr:polysaccharide biosynthesis/export family protein [Planctomycetia bacterium]
MSLPEYTIEPPDILVVDAIKVVPRPPYRIQSLDQVFIAVKGTLAEFPIFGAYSVEPGGTVNLGAPYGSVRLGGLTLAEAAQALNAHLRTYLEAPIVTVTLAQSAAQQQIAGEHLVGPDGTISLGVYGNVYVVGLTKLQAKMAIEAHLARYLEDPVVAVDVAGYNSKVYYIVTQGAGFGDAVYRLPVTGNETVLDAISHVEGLQPHSSKQIWIARPAPPGSPAAQLLTVDWDSIVQTGATETNYQVLPGDRIFIAEDRLVAIDSFVAKAISPIERMMGFTLLGTTTVSRIRFFHQGAVGIGSTGF